MPNYSYKCPNCGQVINVNRPTEERNKLFIHSYCLNKYNKKVTVERLPEIPALVGFEGGSSIN
jgi:predicted nucleic acid-binding Zn ribbon protein